MLSTFSIYQINILNFRSRRHYDDYDYDIIIATILPLANIL